MYNHVEPVAAMQGRVEVYKLRVSLWCGHQKIMVSK